MEQTLPFTHPTGMMVQSGTTKSKRRRQKKKINASSGFVSNRNPTVAEDNEPSQTGSLDHARLLNPIRELHIHDANENSASSQCQNHQNNEENVKPTSTKSTPKKKRKPKTKTVKSSDRQKKLKKGRTASNKATKTNKTMPKAEKVEKDDKRIDWLSFENALEVVMDEEKYSRRQIDSENHSENISKGTDCPMDGALRNLRGLEEKFLIMENFLQEHKTNPTTRETVLHWLIGFHNSLKVAKDETLHLAVTLMDRYLQENNEMRSTLLQLVALSTLWIASKQLGYRDLKVEDLISTYNGGPILNKAFTIMETLDFVLDHPRSVDFLGKYTEIAGVSKECHFLGQYMLELALLKHSMSPIKPSLQAAAACCLSMGILKEVVYLSEVWTTNLVSHTGYEIRHFQDVLVSLSMLLVKSKKRKYSNIREKYASPTYGGISLNPLLNGSISFQFMKPEDTQDKVATEKLDSFTRSSSSSSESGVFTEETTIG
ncbi:G2/mitotic-specific cyclin-B2-like isoform X1 [Leptinotarsa decemlineata]|uniref:G2/mitotic-specific cyclin-B2-like isoform X1 n=1 Tax=Leptinotarsa decemlineata TaxID=7539 RepID=UPI003D30686E